MRLLGEKIDVNSASTDLLSFIGDAVYSLLVREQVCCTGVCRSGALHTESSAQVNAAAQAAAFRKIEPLLTEQETAVYKRGRNAHNKHTPRHAASADYHMATGLEALFGYLYLNDESERIRQLFDIIRAD